MRNTATGFLQITLNSIWQNFDDSKWKKKRNFSEPILEPIDYIGVCRYMYKAGQDGSMLYARQINKNVFTGMLIQNFKHLATEPGSILLFI